VPKKKKDSLTGMKPKPMIGSPRKTGFDIDGDELVNMRGEMFDGAGQPVPPEQAARAVRAFAQLWGTARFDCGPQDYEFIASECAQDLELLDELEKRSDLPEVKRRRNEPAIPLSEAKQPEKHSSVKCPHCGEQTKIGVTPLFDTILMARKRCDHCGLEFLIVNDEPMTEEQYEGKMPNH
jgi:hypothetical protein